MFKKICLMALLLGVCGGAVAGEESAGTVTFQLGQYASGPSSAGLTFFFIDGGTRTNKPACATVYGGERWVINNNWPAAKIQIATLLTAAAANKKIQVRGAGNCAVHDNSETVEDVFIVN